MKPISGLPTALPRLRNAEIAAPCAFDRPMEFEKSDKEYIKVIYISIERNAHRASGTHRNGPGAVVGITLVSLQNQDNETCS
jgi:hypothetical protein